MQITVQLPDDLAKHADPARETLEAVALEAIRSGQFSLPEAARLLGLGRMELEGFLKRRGVTEGSYSVRDLQDDLATLDRLFQAGGSRR